MIERRYAAIAPGRTDRCISGTLLRYGDIAVLGDIRERVSKGAIKIWDDRHGVTMNVQHDRTKLLARTGAGLDLAFGEGGVLFKAVLPKTALCDEALDMVDNNLLRGCSVEYEFRSVEWEGNLRIVNDARLHGMALVDTPAFPDSEIRNLPVPPGTGKADDLLWLWL